MGIEWADCKWAGDSGLPQHCRRGGHNDLSETGGQPYFCGKPGWIESGLLVTALERYYAAHSGQPLGLQKIMAHASAGTDAVANISAFHTAGVTSSGPRIIDHSAAPVGKPLPGDRAGVF